MGGMWALGECRPTTGSAEDEQPRSGFSLFKLVFDNSINSIHLYKLKVCTHVYCYKLQEKLRDQNQI